MKKKYIKPTIIDLSIEGMTGFGYGVLATGCETGYNFAVPSCESGAGANPSCSTGGSPTDECNDGNTPSDRGIVCWAGNSANGRGCLNGPTVSGFYPYCYNGGGGFIGDEGDCNPSGNTANYCFSGNSNVEGFS